MKIAGRGRILFWEGASLWVMEALPAPSGAANATDFHAHHAIQLTLSLGGRFELQAGPECVGGDAIVAPDAQHLLRAEGRIAVLFIEPESAAGRAIAKSCLGGASLAALPAAPIADLKAQLQEAAGAPDIAEARLEAIGRALIARLAGVEGAPQLDGRVRKLMDYAAAHLDGAITLPAAAKAAGLSASRARHLFVEQAGLPFRTWLLWLRITRAVGLFAAGRSLTEAAHEAGFADSAHFSRTFRRMFGLAAASLQVV